MFDSTARIVRNGRLRSILLDLVAADSQRVFLAEIPKPTNVPKKVATLLIDPGNIDELKSWIVRIGCILRLYTLAM